MGINELHPHFVVVNPNNTFGMWINIFWRILNSHLFWLNSHPFFVCPIICKLNLSVCPTPLMFIWLRNLFNNFFPKYIIILLITFHLDIRGGGVDTLKFDLHIIGRGKKGCEFNQKRCEFKIFLFFFSFYDVIIKWPIHIFRLQKSITINKWVFISINNHTIVFIMKLLI